MRRLTKRQKEITTKYDLSRPYSLEEGIKIIKEVSPVQFDASVDLHVKLNVDPKKQDQMVRGIAELPHGTGKVPRILVICTPDKEEEVKKAGADYAGCDEYLKKLENKWKEVDVIIAMPSLMAKVGRVGKVLGPRGLMPNPKSGTVAQNPAQAVKEIRSGKVDVKTDEYGNVHLCVGKVSFSAEKLQENIREVMTTLLRIKPSGAKGTYIKNISITSTMGPRCTLVPHTLLTS